MKYLTIYLFIIFISILLCDGCKTSKESISSDSSDLDRMVQMMSGYFNSATQAQQDSQYFDISLTMLPIWNNDKNSKWLYVEQAVTATLKNPYRQRVYRLTEEDGVFESKVYELPTPDKYVHMWEDKTRMDQLKKENLIERVGCSVFLKPSGDCFKGSTEGNACKSTLRGANYATSVVEICADGIVSWDQGWNDEGDQVWGAMKGGYVFDKINSTEEYCIRSVLSKDTSLGSKRNNDCVEVSLSTTIDRYVKALEDIDFTECPSAFTEAFNNHTVAWTKMKQVTDSYSDLRGEMHELFDQIEASKDSTLFKELLAEVWSTWEVVEKESGVFE